jgi:hypothetical protein
MFNEGKRYKIHSGRISANIDYGDTVKDLATGEIFKVDGGHDVSYINRNFFYKLTDRELHPEPETLEALIQKNESTNAFADWDKLDTLPKKNKNQIFERYIVNGETYKIVKDYTGNGHYFIQTPTGEVYGKRSSISKPFYDAIDIIVGAVRSEYESSTGRRYEHVYKDVEHVIDGSDCLIPTRFKKATEPKSYHYNNRLTYL